MAGYIIYSGKKLRNYSHLNMLFSDSTMCWINSKDVGVLTRGSGSQLVNAVCFLVPDVDTRGNTVTHRFILILATGPYVQQRSWARALNYLAPGVLVVGGTSEAREGGKLLGLC